MATCRIPKRQAGELPLFTEETFLRTQLAGYSPGKAASDHLVTSWQRTFGPAHGTGTNCFE